MSLDDTTDGTSDQTATNQGAGASGEGQTKGDEGWREQNTRLRQELSEQKELNRRAVPFVQVALQLQKHDEATYQKLVKGEQLTKAEQKTVDTAQAASGLTVEQFEEKLDQRVQYLLQRQQADRDAADNMKKLDEWAEKELPGYDNMKGSSTWNGALSSVLNTIENGTFEVPKNEKDPFKYAMKVTYEMIKAQSPELAKGDKRVAKPETERAAEILVGGRKPSASKQSTSELDGLPDETREEIERIRGIGAKVGKKFSP